MPNPKHIQFTESVPFYAITGKNIHAFKHNPFIRVLARIFLTWLLPARFYQNRQVFLAHVSINGLNQGELIVSNLNPSNDQATFEQSTSMQFLL